MWKPKKKKEEILPFPLGFGALYILQLVPACVSTPAG